MKNVCVMAVLFVGMLAMGMGKAYGAAPVQLAIFDPVQIIDRADSVKGLRLNVIYGANEDVSGLDIGLINRTESLQKGLQVGLYNSTFDVSGVQIGLINRTEWLTGLQIGLLNINVNGDRGFFPIINFQF